MAILKRKPEQDATPTRPPRENCDRCIQWAVYRVQIGAVGVLDFCSHHFNRYVAYFMERGWTWKLLERMPNR